MEKKMMEGVDIQCFSIRGAFSTMIFTQDNIIVAG